MNDGSRHYSPPQLAVDNQPRDRFATNTRGSSSVQLALRQAVDALNGSEACKRFGQSDLRLPV